MTLLDALRAAADRDGRITADRLPGAVTAAHLTAHTAGDELDQLIATGQVTHTGNVYVIED